MNAAQQLIGMRFGSWVVLAAERPVWSGREVNVCLCECDCGTTQQILPTALKRGGSTQCRTCSNRQKAAMKSRLTHGQSHTRLHRVWSQMRARCQRETCPDYPRYGGRGITVCSEWADFEVFQAWALANGYQPHLTIDRREVNGNYEPGNCRWITRAAQNRNRRDNVRYRFRGQSLLLPEIAELTGIPFARLANRVRRDGMTPEQAVSKPFRKSPTRKAAQ